ncbi:MAG: lipid-A-disaccharide synthase [Alphaproteobacteria bacterium]|nr:lipid-A-disaccharide synthase [Alphaproteobacteria bacterium]
MDNKPHIIIIAGESSGDALGGELIKELRARKTDLLISGIGGPSMAAQGLNSIFPMADIAVMGLREIVPRLVPIMRRIRETVAYVCRAKPHALVLIDSPEFTHRVARRIKKQLPDLPIIAYVAPTVWAWRHRRARHMTNYFDYVLALLPFEPRVFQQLGGPPCAYVGHPLVKRMLSSAQMQREAQAQSEAQNFRARFAINDNETLLAVLPGSRISEIKRLLPIFGETLRLLAPRLNGLRVGVPVVPHVQQQVAMGVANWPLKVELVADETDKTALFDVARAALTASGTATLELALANLPMIVAYKADIILEYVLRRIVQTPSVVLPNLILDKPVVPEYLMERCTATLLAPALYGLLTNAEGLHDSQSAAFAELQDIMQADNAMQAKNKEPLQNAADKVLELAKI